VCQTDSRRGRFILTRAYDLPFIMRMKTVKNAIAGLCFYEANRGKPVGHATLILAQPNQAGGYDAVCIDYDGFKKPLLEDGAQSLLSGDVVLFPITQDQAQKALNYYRDIEQKGEGAFYFSRDLCHIFRFEAEGRRAVNCYTSVLTILEEKAHVDFAFLRAATNQANRPEAARLALLDSLRKHQTRPVYDRFSLDWFGRDFELAELGERGLHIGRVDGSMTAAELINAAVKHDISQYHDGLVYEKLSRMTPWLLPEGQRQAALAKDAFWASRFEAAQLTKHFTALMMACVMAPVKLGAAFHPSPVLLPRHSVTHR